MSHSSLLVLIQYLVEREIPRNHLSTRLIEYETIVAVSSDEFACDKNLCVAFKTTQSRIFRIEYA